jgi:hypothetical protein
MDVNFFEKILMEGPLRKIIIPCKIFKNCNSSLFFHCVHVILMNLKARQNLQDTQNILLNIYNVCV